MSLTGIQGYTSAGYTSPYHKRDSAIVDGSSNNPATGPDRISFSEDALKMAQGHPTNAANVKEDEVAFKDKAQSDETRNATARGSSLTELSKTSLFSMLLEGLFLAELEESAVNSGDAANGASERANDDGSQRQPGRTPKAKNPLEDGERVAEIKKVLTDFAKGKVELSDLPKVMAGGSASGTGQAASAATPRGEGSATRSGTEE